MKTKVQAALLLTLLKLALLPPLAQAQGVSTPALVPRASDLGPKPAPLDSDPRLLPQRAVPRELQKPEDEVLLDVAAYAVPDDAPEALKQALARLTAPYVGKNKSWEDLVNAKDAVTRFLQSQLGYYLGYAFIPEQTPDKNIIQLAVLEGRLDQVRLLWDEEPWLVDKAVVESYLAQLEPGSILTVSQVERIVFLLNDLRGIVASFEIEPGRRPGTATLVVRPQRERRLAYKLDADLNGSRFIGLGRVGAQMTVASPFGRGDSASLSGLSSVNAGMKFLLGSYSSPVGARGLRAGGAVTLVRYALDKKEFPIGRNGSAVNLNAFGLYPVVRSRNLNWFALLAFDAKHYDDREEASASQTKKQVQSISVASNGDIRDSLLTGGVNSYDLNISTGQVKYITNRPSGLTDANRYTKVNASVSRLQNLWTGRLLAYLSVRGQYSLDNLDTTEQFRLGGPDGVRAFANGEGTGDSGLLASLELRSPLSTLFSSQWAQESVLAFFADYGQVTFRRHPASQLPTGGAAGAGSASNSAAYSGFGLGLAWSRPGLYALRLSVAKPLKGTPTGDTVKRDPRLYAQFSAFF
ncbi:ShlB/FhaC/HecB family hemolysin secretion/activation protein [Kinneretia aquatilis]|uniref:ShlB/FhaC/HecB family hemolysin secretion/activation protein n=1 Tax=Kinneretia aquatilis TaxID=2070761 RepID=UPI0014951D90|nr:ShlB/FhaC/HecB family hemolysin secretion/activation protein [Paucibacter aquatile]WIV95788.1 ShlB/FhaC/HecB family hemolysin secretion/activation protein [Paucibacter aquatile]